MNDLLPPSQRADRDHALRAPRVPGAEGLTHVALVRPLVRITWVHSLADDDVDLLTVLQSPGPGETQHCQVSEKAVERRTAQGEAWVQGAVRQQQVREVKGEERHFSGQSWDRWSGETFAGYGSINVDSRRNENRPAGRFVNDSAGLDALGEHRRGGNCDWLTLSGTRGSAQVKRGVGVCANSPENFFCFPDPRGTGG